MGIISFIIIGLIAGWLAGLIMKGEGFGVIGDIVVGIIGAILGGWLFSLLGFSNYGTIGSLIVAVIGSVIFVFIVHQIKKTT